jgi:hypothetical protein
MLPVLGFIAAAVSISDGRAVEPPVISLSGGSGLTRSDRRLLAASPASQTPSQKSYSYICEASSQCDMPSASAKDFWETSVTVKELDFKLNASGHFEKIDHCCDTTEPSSYMILYDAEDSSGNKAEQVAVTLFVQGKRACLHSFYIGTLIVPTDLQIPLTL